MNDWSSDLNSALVAGDPAYMKAMLARVPADVLKEAMPYLAELAKVNARDGKLKEAIAIYDQLIESTPGNVEWLISRAQTFIRLDRLEDALIDSKKVAELRPGDAMGYRLQAEAHDGLHQMPQAIAAYRNALRLAPDDTVMQQRVRSLEAELRTAALLQNTLDPEAAKASSEGVLPLPSITVDPALFDHPGLPDTMDPSMVGGLTPHLRRYSNHQSSKNTLGRMDDPAWLALWDQALKSTVGLKTLFYGSELGTFALRALHHGSAKVVAVEEQPLSGRISTGIVQKQMLAAWHTLHGTALQGLTEDDRRQSFEEFASDIEVVPPDSVHLKDGSFECLVFPDIDHSLLGTGLVKAIRQLRAEALSDHISILPARARIYAMGIQWIYPGIEFDLNPINQLRWSLSPDALDVPPTCWSALTDSVLVGELDFENFSETTWDARLPVRKSGDLNALVYWFELDIGSVQLSNAPFSELRCIRPAVQHVDTTTLAADQTLQIEVRVSETRLYFRTQPPPMLERSHLLPSWYVPMVLDEARNTAFARAIQGLLETNTTQTVLDIGAGFGLLSMMAAQGSAAQVYACEIDQSIARVADEILKINGFAGRVKLVNKDCRALSVPTDLPARADIAVFELFDCSLIGEGVLHFLAHAREHLLTENARYLPMGAIVRAMVVEYRMNQVWDIDVNILNPYRFSQSFINVDASKLPYRPLTEPFDVFAFDFAHATPTPHEKEISVSAIADGTAGAVLFWFDLQLDESTWLTNSPIANSSLHWKQALQFLPEVRVNRDLVLPVAVKHDGSGTAFRWRLEELPKEAFSALPRFDPRSFHQATELQTQTRSILQHCMSDPSEYLKVAELATRFAIDPGAHDIDPQIAKRFAAMFFGN